MRRRALLSCGCAGVVAGLARPKPVSGGPSGLFCAALVNSDLSNARTSNTTGDGKLDAALIFEAQRVRSFFGVHPGFRILDDGGSPNAYAVPFALVPETEGTVLLGRTLIRTEIFEQMGGIAVGGIVAHECGHILQFQSGMAQRLSSGQATARLVELHADYMAGFYFGVRAASKALDVTPFANSLFRKGDWAFNDPSHHGTPEERTNAMFAGFRFGKEYDATASQALSQGARYVQSI